MFVKKIVVVVVSSTSNDRLSNHSMILFASSLLFALTYSNDSSYAPVKVDGPACD